MLRPSGPADVYPASTSNHDTVKTPVPPVGVATALPSQLFVQDIGVSTTVTSNTGAGSIVKLAVSVHRLPSVTVAM